MSEHRPIPKFKVKKEFNPLAGQPHTWKGKFPGMTPWTDDWKTSHNMMLPKQGFHPSHLDIPDDGFSLGDPLDDISYWELHWTAGQRPRKYAEDDDDATISDPGMRDVENSEYNDDEPTISDPGMRDDENWSGTDAESEHSDQESDSDATEPFESSKQHRGASNGIGGMRNLGSQKEHKYDSDEDASNETDNEMDIDGAQASAPPHPPPQLPKMISFELRLLNSHRQRRIQPFIVQIYPQDTSDDILSAVGNFFGGANGSIRVTGFEDNDGQAFVPRYENLVHHEIVHVLCVDAAAEAEALRIERERSEKELLEKKNLARAKRRKLNGGLTKIGRKRAWAKSGGPERKRVNGKFA